MPDTTIADRLAGIRALIDKAARERAVQGPEVTLVAVSKTHGQDAVLAAMAAGATHFGENRVQEAAAKFSDLRASHDFRLHLIGGLQTNKAAEAMALCDMIESLDRPKLAVAIETLAVRGVRLPDLLVQVNIGDEPQKSGIPTHEADRFIGESIARFGPKLCGLMAIPPAGLDPTPYFQALARLADKHRLAVRSMGMSADFEIAIAQGATHVRVGSALFGAR
ncbi:MAG: YggS family pyridoxal phosphate enzyme [Rhodospirillales bacterium 20-60-12]|nr:MAG: YggS family pyridoxal phosphate enzyme [Rhodospirillales bacterium 20-60-12]HQT66973.1 YggS family pyridoxal phosphate-dependent enzyme [Acetobacteraceae bacterium]